MIDLNSVKADEVLKVLVFIAPVMGLITARTVMLAQLKLDGEPMKRIRADKLTRFTANDYTVFGMTLIPSLIVVVAALNKASFPYIMDVLAALRSDWGFMGWMLTCVWWLHVIAPFAVGLMLYIGRRRRFRKYGHIVKHQREFGVYLG